MKHVLWLAFLLPSIAFSQGGPFTEEFCNANPADAICVGFNIDRADVDANEAILADHETRITDLETVLNEPFMAKLSAEDSVGTLFNSFVEADGPEGTKDAFKLWVDQPDGTFAIVGISLGTWKTGNIRYSGTGCTGTAYFKANWSWRSIGSDEGSIAINAQAGFDGVLYTFSIGDTFSATVASNSVIGHPITAPVCNNFSPFLQTGLRLAMPVQGLPAVIVPPSVATIQLSP